LIYSVLMFWHGIAYYLSEATQIFLKCFFFSAAT
jgi:hypothetical protein